LTKQETAIVVREQLSVAGKSINEILEAKNHDTALSYVFSLAKKLPIHKISQSHILHIHELILSGIDDSSAGTYRQVPVRIAGSRTILPNYFKVPKLMDELEHWLHTTKIDPLNIACELHYRLVSIHPFVDGNGRTARLLFNLILLIAGYPASYIAKEQRASYLSVLEKAQTTGDKKAYEKLMLASVERSLDLYLDTLSNKKQSSQKSDTTLITISRIAKASGETVPTIRYWTQMGLIEYTKTTPSGYALYDESVVNKIRTIRHLQKELRLSLEEIKGMV
jgi:Fic family protein